MLNPTPSPRVVILDFNDSGKQLIDQHKELTDKFLKGELDEHDLSKPNSAQGLQPLSCTNWA